MTGVRLEIRKPGRMTGGAAGHQEVEAYEGADAEEVMDKWNQSAWWAAYPPEEFRHQVIWANGLDVRMPCSDDEILTDLASKAEEVSFGPSRSISALASAAVGRGPRATGRQVTQP